MKRVLEAASPRVIVEVGVLRGGTTVKLLELASRLGCLVHSIDPSPSPQFDVEELQRRHERRLVFHRERSLDALGQIARPDAVLIDGDHNWYTVYHELKLLEQRTAGTGHAFPLILLHDIGWPYGRRDQYHEPDAIPDEYRHPFRKAGIVLGQPELSDREGLNATYNNAEVEGTERNGILTAVEDFRSESELPLHFLSLNGFHGLGILAAKQRVQANENLRRVLAEFESPEWLEEQCRRIEYARLHTLMQLCEVRVL